MLAFVIKLNGCFANTLFHDRLYLTEILDNRLTFIDVQKITLH